MPDLSALLSRVAYFLRTRYWNTAERVNPDFPDTNFLNHFEVYKFLYQLSVGKEVLDLGCGTGYGTAHLAAAAKSVVGIDISGAAIRFARRRYPGITFLQMDAEKLDFARESFDLVVSSENFEHLCDQSRSLDETRRVLRRDGLFFLATPNPEMLVGTHNPYHRKENTYQELKELLESSFRKVLIVENLLQPPTAEGQAAQQLRFLGGEHGFIVRESLEVFGQRLEIAHLSNTHSFFCFMKEPHEG